jgi:hypothetical protein
VAFKNVFVTSDYLLIMLSDNSVYLLDLLLFHFCHLVSQVFEQKLVLLFLVKGRFSCLF